MLKVLIVIAAAMLTIYCVVEVAQSGKYKTRLLPRWLWAFVVITMPVIGSLAWLLTGRPTAKPKPNPPKAPDDDDDFLRKIR